MTRSPNRALAWLAHTSRRRRVTFYAAVAGLLLLALTPATRSVLTILQFNETAVAEWSDALRGEALSFIALLIIAAYFDLVTRQDHRQEIAAERESLMILVRDEFQAATSNLRSEFESHVENLIDAHPDKLAAALSSQISSQLAEQLRPTLQDLGERQLSTYTPIECVSSGLQRALGGDRRDVEALSELIMGRGADYVLSDADFGFRFENLGDALVKVDARFTQTTRFPTYQVALVRDDFTSESRLLSSGTLSDAWIFTEETCFRSSVELAEHACVNVRYRDSRNVLVREIRPFQIVASEDGEHRLAEVVLEADLSVPDDVRSAPIIEVCVSVVLPAKPSGFRWLFDTPTFMREISFDIRSLYNGEPLDVTLYPFLMGTEDYTLRSVERQDIYRIGVNAWLLRGHGVFLNWERAGNGLVGNTHT